MFEFFKNEKMEPVQVASALSAGFGGKPKTNKLKIWFENGGETSWWVTPWTGTERIEPWKDFYRWWFGRDSESYVMRWEKGETMIRRKDIKRFSVKIIEAAPPNSGANRR